MAGIYAISDFDLDYIYQSLSKNFKVTIDDLKCNVVLISNKKFLLRNIDKINKSLNRKTFFVFGTPAYLKEFNIQQISNSVLTPAKLKAFVNRKNPTIVTYKKIDIAKKLLRKTKVSVIRNIQTLLYKVQNKELRLNYRNIIFTYLSNEKNDVENLEKSLILVSKKKSSTTKELIKIIQSDIFKETHEAVILHKKGNQKTKISKFDINYILSFKSKVN